MWSTTLRIHTLEDFVLVDIAEQPLFDLALWNMYDQTIGDLLRTNNAVEGWHLEIYRHLEAGTKSKPCQHFTSSSWPSTRASTSLLSRQPPTNKEYRPRLPQHGQIAVSPWPRPQHQYVFLKATKLPAHSKNKSYKISEKNALSGGFLSGGFLARGVFVQGVFVRGFMSGGFLS